MINYRDTGLGSFLSGATNDTTFIRGHLGFGMMSELCLMNTFYDAGTLDLSYGLRYLQELLNVIPRALWPEKPLLGVDYAMLRGFGDDNGGSEIGVFATISSGLIGQGFLNFGPFLGPAAAAALFGAWVVVLARFWKQGASVPRLALFLLGLGLTFNLGRDFTLLVLWPVVFGYTIVRILERRAQR